MSVYEIQRCLDVCTSIAGAQTDSTAQPGRSDTSAQYKIRLKKILKIMVLVMPRKRQEDDT